MTPVEAMIDLALETDFEQLFIQPSLYPQDPDVLLTVHAPPAHGDDVLRLRRARQPDLDSSIQTHLLGHWVRDRQEFTLEEAVRMLTLAPAMAWGFADRGLLREGMVADLNVFDPDQRRRRRCPRSSPTSPPAASGSRSGPIGFRATVVDGEITILDGEPTGARCPVAWCGPVVS